MQRASRSVRNPGKPPSTEAALRRQLAEEKKENTKLRREVARLGREVRSLRDSEAQDEAEAVVVAPKRKAGGCAACGDANKTIVELPSGSMILCGGCGARDFVRNEARLSA